MNYIMTSNILPVLSSTPRHTDVWKTGGTAPHIHNIITTWRSVVSFTQQKFYRRGKSYRFPFERRKGGTQNRSGLLEKWRLSVSCREFNAKSLIVQPIALTLYRLSCFCSFRLFSVTKKSNYILQLKHTVYLKLRIMCQCWRVVFMPFWQQKDLILKTFSPQNTQSNIRSGFG
jgi:hypothetical protein